MTEFKRNTQAFFFLVFSILTSITHQWIYRVYIHFSFLFFFFLPWISHEGDLWISKYSLSLASILVISASDHIILLSYYRFPMMIDPSEISGRFLQYRECTFINGLDHEFINSPDRIRIATLAALRSVKPLGTIHNIYIFQCLCLW